MKGNRKRWQCPECRQIHVCSVDSLSRNYLVEKFVEKFKKQAEQSIPSPDEKIEFCEKHNRPFEASKF